MEKLRKVTEASFAIVLSVVFTVALIYATLEAPRVISRLLLQVFPDYAAMGQWEEAWQMAESLRPFGYVSFVATLILIFAGFAAKRGKLSTLGSISLFLPTFGYFAFTMFFLAGIGVMRSLWFPLMDLSPSILRLGDIVYAPFLILSLSFALVRMDIGIPLSLTSMGIGVFVFFLGVSTWLYGKFKGSEIIYFWIYRYSRHPQYLGFLLWSYGLLLFVSFLDAPKGGYVPPPSLPWLLSALTIIGVALHEENVMIEKHGEKYARYYDNTPFMIPLPKQLSALIVVPARALLRKNRPENGKGVALIMIVYGVTLVLLSHLWILFFPM